MKIMMMLFLSLTFVDVGLAKDTSRATSSTKPPRVINLPMNQEELAIRCNKEAENLSTDYFVAHKAYSLSYNFNHKVANWVYHRINRENLKHSCVERKNKFKADPELLKNKLPAVGQNDYKNTGFDRGHMAPSGDFEWDKQINAESFFMTNMSPQTEGLNQKAWVNLENRIRLWACGHGELRVYTGPILKDGLNRLNSCVSVPEQFYKVILSYKDNKYKGIAFIYNQTDSGDPYREKAVSIRTVETATGLDFFKDEFAQAVQDSFEKEFSWPDWDGTEVACKATCPSTGTSAGTNN